MSKEKKKFDWDSFKQNGDACVHCKTKTEARQFLQLMFAHDMINEINYDNLIRMYDVHKENTVYYSDKCYDSIKYANNCGHPIMMFNKYDFREEVNGYGT